MLVVPGRVGEPVTLLPLALTTVLEEDAGVFNFQLRQTGPRDWCLTLGPGEAPTPVLRSRCRQVLAAFAEEQGAAGLRIVTRHAGALPRGASGKAPAGDGDTATQAVAARLSAFHLGDSLHF